MFVKIKLPAPSLKILSEIDSIAKTSSFELDLKRKHEHIQNYQVNAVSRKFIEDNDLINELVYKEYKSYFQEDFFPAVGIVTNLETNRIACWPPHSDRTRIFALNYYITEGGNNVETIMYDRYDDYISGQGTGKIFKYNELTLDKTYHLKTNQWYALNARQVHSIENILTQRIILTISFHHLNFFEFCNKYQNLIDGEESYKR